MPNKIKHQLRRESSANYSGRINEKIIPTIKDRDYIIVNKPLDGDAPKAFIKIYRYGKGCNRKNTKTWEAYIAKTGEKWYPHESVIEYLINRIGHVLGIRMNEVLLMKVNGQIRFLSRYFLNQEYEVMTHGAEIFGEYIDDMEMAQEIANNKIESRKHFTFEFLVEAIEHKYPNCHEEILNDIVKMIIFDAIVGNNDRHFYNWAVITSIKRNAKAPQLSPLYDSARGLTWNWSDDRIKKYIEQEKSNGKKIDRYINEACPRISVNENFNINHFDLIFFLKKFKNSKYLKIIDDLCSPQREELVLEMIKKEFSDFFVLERYELIKRIIKTRFSILREEVLC
ncbi:HipA domain-containing protein [Sphingobacterium sp. DN00404]|uniref:HipA domain-containing protein n=1 Tax=Sphingobacterium micropteri TaxID=2763501 RepID=A0ABR7YM58_9SPHI|nr:HipA domain-containing protein [Sphingobacterium micropteri]MBD1432316.1 HipA domain-containing protein [Sphingobacterium micropteri]